MRAFAVRRRRKQPRGFWWWLAVWWLVLLLPRLLGDLILIFTGTAPVNIACVIELSQVVGGIGWATSILRHDQATERRWLAFYLPFWALGLFTTWH